MTISQRDELRALEGEVRARNESLKAQLDAQNKRLDIQDKRLDTFTAVGSIDASRFGVVATVLGVLVTGVVIFFALRTSSLAIAEAKVEVEKLVRGYRDDFTTLAETAKKTETTTKDVLRKVEAIARTHLDDIEKLHAEATKSNEKIAVIIEAAERRQGLLSTGAASTTSDPVLAAAASDAAAQPISTQGFEGWYLQGLAAHDRRDYQAALDFYEQAEDLAPDFVARAKVLNSRARALRYSGQRDAADTLWSRVFNTYGKLLTEHPELTPEITKAQISMADSLGDRGQGSSALAVYDDVVARFGAATELPLREQVGRALYNKGVTLSQLDLPNEALAVYDDVIGRFGAATELPLREQVAAALVNKGVTLGQLDRPNDALVVYDDVVARFGAATGLLSRELVAKALVNKGITLDQLDRPNDALAVYDDVVARFGAATELPLRELVTRAGSLKGMLLG